MKILSIVRVAEAGRKRIESVDQSISLIDAAGWFDGEIRATWPDYATRNYMNRAPGPNKSTGELNDALAGAEGLAGLFAEGGKNLFGDRHRIT